MYICPAYSQHLWSISINCNIGKSPCAKGTYGFHSIACYDLLEWEPDQRDSSHGHPESLGLGDLRSSYPRQNSVGLDGEWA